MEYTPMTRAEIMLGIANSYPDDQIFAYYDKNLDVIRETFDAGDTLAEFIVREIFDSTNEELDPENVDCALRALDIAIEDLYGVREGIIQAASRKGRGSTNG